MVKNHGMCKSKQGMEYYTVVKKETEKNQQPAQTSITMNVLPSVWRGDSVTCS